MNQRGGRRSGAGRKKGSSSKIKLEHVADSFKSEAFKTPLEVMTIVMNECLHQKKYKLAIEAAKGAAPYMHARLSDVKVDASVHHIKHVEEMTDEELDVFIGDADR
ncbi:hypothetical protein COMNV_00595 [Commensalibacter sp. Nvir]|uniref:hypothetical protein n=1 Tax=Commensalibacter sp. Nvir TaxID=3069817 RepID=UPI002D29F30A|nr:hypothetical protein COMNV_00595 [Commensalibacter sp. Nvir]